MMLIFIIIRLFYINEGEQNNKEEEEVETRR